MNTCSACNSPVLVAMNGSTDTAFQPEPSVRGDHTITVGKDQVRRAVKLRPNQIPGARHYGTPLYELHRKHCVKSLSHRGGVR